MRKGMIPAYKEPVVEKKQLEETKNYSDCSLCVYSTEVEFKHYHCQAVRAQLPPQPNCNTRQVVCIYFKTKKR